MKILIAEDDIFTNRMLQKFLVDLGYDITAAFDGHQAWEIFCQDEVHFVITDWMMPVMNGLDFVEKIRKTDETAYCYIILLTAKNGKDAIVEGISAGADDYIVKPFDKEELAVRVRAGQRIIELQQELHETNKAQKKLIIELEDALSRIKQLSGFLPICSSCKKIRDDKGYWNQIEQYIRDHSEAEFSHGICPDCAKKLYPGIYNGKADSPKKSH
jgi:sigma-B regulation protein RsbU (phosphoserine phosphatase)